MDHLRGGLDKLNEATSEVDTLSKSAVAQRALLTQKQEEADAAMTGIQKSMERAVERKGEVEMLQKKLGTEEEEMTRRKGGVEEARPVPTCYTRYTRYTGYTCYT